MSCLSENFVKANFCLKCWLDTYGQPYKIFEFFSKELFLTRTFWNPICSFLSSKMYIRTELLIWKLLKKKNLIRIIIKNGIQTSINIIAINWYKKFPKSIKFYYSPIIWKSLFSLYISTYKFSTSIWIVNFIEFPQLLFLHKRTYRSL